MFNMTLEDFHSRPAVHGDETKHSFLHCRPYQTEVNRRQKIRSEVLVKKFGANVLLREDFSTLKLTVAHDIIQR